MEALQTTPRTHSGSVDQDFPTEHQEMVAVVATVEVAMAEVKVEDVEEEEDSRE